MRCVTARRNPIITHLRLAHQRLKTHQSIGGALQQDDEGEAHRISSNRTRDVIDQIDYAAGG